jgi:hypothetical protein
MKVNPSIGGMVNTIPIVVVMLVAGWLLLAWAIIKRAVLAVPAAAFTGLCCWSDCATPRRWRSTC